MKPYIPLTLASMALTTIPILGRNKSKIAKAVIPVMAIVAVGGVAYVGYKYLQKDVPPKLHTNPALPKSTLSDTQAKFISERLYNAMKGSGTDEAAILKALQGLTENDFVKVYESFGKRQYSMFWGNIGDPLTSSNHHLITWLTNELNESEINDLKKVIPNLLTVAL